MDAQADALETLAVALSATRLGALVDTITGVFGFRVSELAAELRQNAQTLRDMAAEREQELFDRQVNERFGLPNDRPRF